MYRADAPFITHPPTTATDPSRAVHPSAGNAAAPASIPARILLAEDGLDNRRLIAFYLKKTGAQVTVVTNGRHACEHVARAATAGEPFDLVLMDMQMPELDGYAAAGRLRAEGYDLPIIALTADEGPGAREQCLRSGCTDYIRKPPERRQLIDLIARHLRGVGVTLNDLGVATTAPHAAASDAGDTGLLRSPLSDDPETAPFVALYVQSLPAQVGRLGALARAYDRLHLAAGLHALKGTGGLYGFPALTDRAAAAEALARAADAPPQAVAEAIEELTRCARRVDGYDATREHAVEPKPPAGAPPTGHAPPHAQPARQTVLIVDDMGMIRDLISASLDRAGYHTVCATDGADALRALRNGGCRADLIVLDVQMPGMDGLTFLQHLRADRDRAALPVILLSGAERRSDILAAARFGVRGYILKSTFSLPELLTRIRSALNPAADDGGDTHAARA